MLLSLPQPRMKKAIAENRLIALKAWMTRELNQSRDCPWSRTNWSEPTAKTRRVRPPQSVLSCLTWE